MQSTAAKIIESSVGKRKPIELVKHSQKMTMNHTLAEAYRVIEAKKVDFMAAVDAEDRLLGLVSRDRLGKYLGTRFGYPLYGAEPVSAFLINDPLTCAADSSMLDLINLALSRPVETLLDDVVVLDGRGRVFGLIPYYSLVTEQLQLVNDTLIQLHQQKEALESKNRELEVATAAALESTRAKSNFLATMSHELRTPMNGVLGMLNLLETTNLDEEQADYVQTGARSAEALLSLINDVLDLSKLESGRIECEHIPFDLADEMRGIKSLLAPQAEKKGLSFVIDWQVKPGRPLVGDPNRLRQILMNLVGNAIKFTPTGGVRLVVDRQPGKGEVWNFAVKDTGIGIAPEVQAKLFQPFTQADSSATRQFGGTGLGLAISQQLVGILGGARITIQSERGQGSTFSFSLPFGKSAQAGVEADVQPIERCALVVDDNPVNRVILEKRLRNLHIHCLTVTNGEEAFRVLRERSFDIVFMDCHMPVLDGPAATRQFRRWEAEQKPSLDRTPIVAVSADTDSANRNACLEAGMDGFIPKPLAAADLSQAIAKHCGSSASASTPVFSDAPER